MSGNYRSVQKAISWIIALLGLWEFGDIVLPFVIGSGKVQVFVWNHIIAGIILMIAGAWAAVTSDMRTAKAMAWVAAAAGLWLILGPFILGARAIAGGLWNDIAVGVLALVLSAASLLLLQRRA